MKLSLYEIPSKGIVHYVFRIELSIRIVLHRTIHPVVFYNRHGSTGKLIQIMLQHEGINTGRGPPPDDGLLQRNRPPKLHEGGKICVLHGSAQS